jgi:hypothetical protein
MLDSSKKMWKGKKMIIGIIGSKGIYSNLFNELALEML